MYAGKAWSCDMLAEPAWNNFAGLRHNPSWYLLISSDHLVWWSLMYTIHLDVYTLNLQCPGDIVSNTNMACPKVEGNVLPMRYLASPAGYRNLRCHWCHDCVTTGTWEGIPVEDIQIAKAREWRAPQIAPSKGEGRGHPCELPITYKIL